MRKQGERFWLNYSYAGLRQAVLNFSYECLGYLLRITAQRDTFAVVRLIRKRRTQVSQSRLALNFHKSSVVVNLK